MRTFNEWLGEREVFSMGEDDHSVVLYCEDLDEYFWVVHARDWESIHREPKWWAIRLVNQQEARNFLGENEKREFSLRQKEILDKVQEMEPDMGNRSPLTRSFTSLNEAIRKLAY